jgi:hypothetical protein
LALILKSQASIPNPCTKSIRNALNLKIKAIEAIDIRKIIYWNVFTGAAGQTYGPHSVWQMYDLDKVPFNGPLKP